MATIEPNSFEFQLFWFLTIIILITKALCVAYLLRKIIIRKKETGEIPKDFVFCVFIMLLCLFISRLCYFYYEFYLIRQDRSLSHLYPNIKLIE